MNVKVLSIEPRKETGTFDVLVLIGTEEHKFTMTVDSHLVANKEIQVPNGDRHFSETFKFHQMIALKISKLVSKVYNNQAVELPVDVDESYYNELAAYV